MAEQQRFSAASIRFPSGEKFRQMAQTSRDEAHAQRSPWLIFPLSRRTTSGSHSRATGVGSSGRQKRYLRFSSVKLSTLSAASTILTTKGDPPRQVTVRQ